MSYSVRVLLILGALCLSARTAQGQDPDLQFPGFQVNGALSEAKSFYAEGNQSFQFANIQQRDGRYSSKRLASYHEGIIYLYLKPIRRKWGHGLNYYYARGLLTSLLIHELIHDCLSDLGAPSDPPGGEGADCHEEEFSCEHLAVANKSIDATCGAAAHKKAELSHATDPDERDRLEKELEGLCAGLNNEREKWNGGEGFAAAKDCYGGSPPCPLMPRGDPPSPPSDCGVSLPPMGAGGTPGNPFPGGEVFPPCSACGEGE